MRTDVIRVGAGFKPAPTSGALRTDVLLERGVTPRDSRIVASAWQDVAPILERNAALRAAPQPPRRREDFGRHVASVPAVVLVKWLNEEHARGNTALRMFTAEFNALVARKLSDPDWAYLRVDR
jgi:hypothetical protein